MRALQAAGYRAQSVTVTGDPSIEIANYAIGAQAMAGTKPDGYEAALNRVYAMALAQYGVMGLVKSQPR